ncbi:hypothetical protein [Coleofasciculus chthonoplastes]|uniref:hypothetical protein n=1 Tax=Coleofasciculus chthonoplastes TaxID=64178 RepID=UPI0032F2ECD9
MIFWQNFSETFRRDSPKYQALFLPEYRIDVDYDTTPINAGEAYCRLWLVEMRLARDVDWFRERYPVVHAAIRFNAISLCSTLSKVYITLDNSQKLGLVVFLEYINKLDSNLSTDDQYFMGLP